jgi:hypothetical protein
MKINDNKIQWHIYIQVLQGIIMINRWFALNALEIYNMAGTVTWSD